MTDERGVGLNAGPLDGYNGDLPACPGGGIWFYNITDERNPRLMTLPDGKPGVFITRNFLQTDANCTVHYGTQFEDENLLVFAWYTQGIHVLRYTPDFAKNQISFDEVATYIPAGASTWTAKGLIRNPADPDELVIYTADITRGFDALTVRVPRQKPTAKPASKPKVLGRKLTQETHPATGVGDPAGLGILLVVLAASLASWQGHVTHEPR